MQQILKSKKMKNDKKVEFNILVLKPPHTLSPYLTNLITYLKHMIIKTSKKL